MTQMQYELFDPEELMPPPQETEPRTIEELEEVFGPKREAPPPRSSCPPAQHAEIMRFKMMHRNEELGVIVVNENIYDTVLSFYAFPMEYILSQGVLSAETSCAKGVISNRDCDFLNEVWDYDTNAIQRHVTAALNATYISNRPPCAKTFTPEA